MRETTTADRAKGRKVARDTERVPARTARNGPKVVPTPGHSTASKPPDGKIRLLTRDALDGRTRARKQFDAIVRGIVSDRAGEANLSTVEIHLIENFASVAVAISDLSAKLLLGEPIAIAEFCTLSSTAVRLAHRIGITRTQKEVGPTLSDYLREEAAP